MSGVVGRKIIVRQFMKAFSAVALVSLLSAGTTQANPMTQAESEAFVAPFYALLSHAGTADIATEMAGMVTPDYMSYSANAGGQAVPEIAAGLKGLATAVPDLTWTVVEVIPAEDKIIVRGEATGTPVVPLFGIPPSGKSFKIMSIDIWTLVDGKAKSIHHVEDWATAMRQLAGG
jgi:predicted ester cyclase